MTEGQPMDADLAAAVHEHCERFNEGVRSGDWGPFVATFAEDAELRFTDLPMGPIAGREAIARAYEARPPGEEMTITTVEVVDASTVDVEFRWASGRDGRMTVRWRGGEVASVELARV